MSDELTDINAAFIAGAVAGSDDADEYASDLERQVADLESRLRAQQQVIEAARELDEQLAEAVRRLTRIDGLTNQPDMSGKREASAHEVAHEPRGPMHGARTRYRAALASIEDPRCEADITDRSNERSFHACVKVRGHAGSHYDGGAMNWTGRP